LLFRIRDSLPLLCMKGQITILGSGTSQGVPVIACECEVCSSNDPRDYRTRSSILVEFNGENYVVDAGPDFRNQMLREKVKSLKGVLFTHEHKDHVAGLDDVRPFNYREGRDMEVYAGKRVQEALKREYHYIFATERYPGIPKISLFELKNEPFVLPNNLPVLPIEVLHYKLPVFGFRFGDLTYITDAKTVSEEERKKIYGSKILIVNCLHHSPHISHFNLEEALRFIEDISPEKAYLTHISHLFGKHTSILKELPENVEVAYDGLKLPFEIKE
jgi:phosphoribosyl 1,2-cyclic phosphate phosphodiesterase